MIKKLIKNLAEKEKLLTFATAFREMPCKDRLKAGIAQLVERDLAKVEVAGPSPVCRSFFCFPQEKMKPIIS